MFGFTSADNSSSKLAVSTAVSAQTEQLAQTGTSMALIVIGNNPGSKTVSSTQKTTMGGTVTYSAAPYGSSDCKITSTASIVSGTDTKTVRTTSIAYYNKGRWRISSAFTETL